MNTKSYRRTGLSAMVLLLVAGAGLFLFLQSRQASKIPEQDMVTVVLGDIEENVTAQGKLEPKEFLDVGAQVIGQLIKLHANIGEDVRTRLHVEESQVQARLDVLTAAVLLFVAVGGGCDA